MNLAGKPIASFNLTSIADVRAILGALDLQPAKALGQNFLIDANILGIILKAAGLSAADRVLEIGAGLGTLTEALARVAQKVVAIEKDSRLAAFLKSRFQPMKNIELITADAMRIDLGTYWVAGFNKLVANLPYSVGSAVLVNIFKGDVRPEMIVVTLQAEVASRLTAETDTADYGLLSIWSQLSYETEICRLISPTCFFPRPEVQSAVVAMKKRARPAEEPADRKFFFDLTKYAFGQRRKQMQKILSDAPAGIGRPAQELQGIFAALEMDPRIRPGALSLEQWIRLANRLGEAGIKNASAGHER